MASADWFTITVHGRGGHAAVPEATVDPVLTAAHIIVAAQGIVSRNVSPTQPAVLSITQVHGGEAPNVTPETVVLGGTVRAFDPRVRALMRRRLEEIATHTAQAHGARAEVEYREGCPPAVNDAAAAALVSEACSSVLGADQVSVWAPQTVGEDFACFLERVPGCFYFLGMRDETAGSVWPHHHPRFTVDERALPLGVATFVALAERVLG
jgi:amidohydrolase